MWVAKIVLLQCHSLAWPSIMPVTLPPSSMPLRAYNHARRRSFGHCCQSVGLSAHQDAARAKVKQQVGSFSQQVQASGRLQ